MEPFKNKIWLSSPTTHGEELQYVKEAYETNWMSTVGKNINEAEKLASEKVGCKYAVGLCCGTAALHLAGCSSGRSVSARGGCPARRGRFHCGAWRLGYA